MLNVSLSGLSQNGSCTSWPQPCGDKECALKRPRELRSAVMASPAYIALAPGVQHDDFRLRSRVVVEAYGAVGHHPVHAALVAVGRGHRVDRQQLAGFGLRGKQVFFND